MRANHGRAFRPTVGRLSCFGRWALTGDFVRPTYPQCLNACFPPSVRRSNSDGFPSQHTARGPATSLACRLNKTDSFRAAQLFQESFLRPLRITVTVSHSTVQPQLMSKRLDVRRVAVKISLMSSLCLAILVQNSGDGGFQGEGSPEPPWRRIKKQVLPIKKIRDLPFSRPSYFSTLSLIFGTDF